MVSIDRISNLPDSLLQRIMSFLESQEAVQTCVLSKRWKKLWASLQCLRLDLSKFEAGEQFTKFVNSLLLLRDTSDLHTFHLICCPYNGDVCHSTVTTWILYAIKRNAKVIEIDVTDFEMLPQCMFSSSSLEELNLSTLSKDKGIGSRAINLPRLKKLELSVTSQDSDILNELALGCPALEDLYLNECFIDMRVVSFPKLKYLNISSWMEDDETWIESIRTPNLVSLVLHGYAQLFEETFLEKMPSLANAAISLRGCYNYDAEKCMLRAVANVKNLMLSGRAITDLFAIELPRCPTFFNLTTLLLRCLCMICDSNEVGDFLKHTPNLKKLTLSLDNYDKHECDLEADEGSKSIKSALSQCKNLDEIEVKLKSIEVRTKQLLYALVESLAELKTTCLILSFHCTGSTSPSLTEFHQFALSMIEGNNVLALIDGNKFVVWSK